MELRERNKDYYPHGLRPHLARIGQVAGFCGNSIETKTGDDTG